MAACTDAGAGDTPPLFRFTRLHSTVNASCTCIQNDSSPASSCGVPEYLVSVSINSGKARGFRLAATGKKAVLRNWRRVFIFFQVSGIKYQGLLSIANAAPKKHPCMSLNQDKLAGLPVVLLMAARFKLVKVHAA